jgi:hypothetical protein
VRCRFNTIATILWLTICGVSIEGGDEHDDDADDDDAMSRLETKDIPGPDFKFSAEHDWLKDAVALRLKESSSPQIIEGKVHDGSFDSKNSDEGYVMDGVYDRAALHRACWELSGQKEWQVIAGIAGSPEWKKLKKYHEQLFNFVELAKDGFAWMLADPTLDQAESQKNRQRIQAMLGNDAAA